MILASRLGIRRGGIGQTQNKLRWNAKLLSWMGKQVQYS